MHEFWATETLRFYVSVILATWGARVFGVGDVENRAAEWAMRVALTLLAARWMGAF